MSVGRDMSTRDQTQEQIKPGQRRIRSIFVDEQFPYNPKQFERYRSRHSSVIRPGEM